jgi:hypothetical protein
VWVAVRRFARSIIGRFVLAPRFAKRLPVRCQISPGEVDPKDRGLTERRVADGSGDGTAQRGEDDPRVVRNPQLKINHIRIVDGQITYVDRGQAKPLRMSRLNIKLRRTRATGRDGQDEQSGPPELTSRYATMAGSNRITT